MLPLDGWLNSHIQQTCTMSSTIISGFSRTLQAGSMAKTIKMNFNEQMYCPKLSKQKSRALWMYGSVELYWVHAKPISVQECLNESQVNMWWWCDSGADGGEREGYIYQQRYNMKKKNHFSTPCSVDQIPQNIESTSGYCHLERIWKTYEFP